MPRYYISGLEIEGFRGINNEKMPLKLRFNEKKVNSIFAPNGAGKSSIFDALCFAIKEEIPRLSSLPRSENGNSYYVNQFHSLGTGLIKITFKPDDSSADVTITVKCNKAGKRVIHNATCSDPEEFLKALDNDCLLIDYQTFNKFVSNSPLDRGRSFSSLIGLSKMSNLKQALDSLKRTVDNDLNLQVLQTEISALKSNLNTYFKDINVALSKLGINQLAVFRRVEIESAIIKKLLEIQLIKPYVIVNELSKINFDDLVKAVRVAEGGEARIDLSKKIQESESYKELISKSADNERAELNKIVDKLQEKEDMLQKSLDELFYKLYKAALSIVEKDDWNKNTCPLCNNHVVYENNDNLLDRVRLYIQEYDKVEQLKSEAISLWKAFSGKKRINALERQLGKLDIKNSNTNILFSELELKFAADTIRSQDIKDVIGQIQRYDEALKLKIQGLEGEISNIKASLPASLVNIVEIIENARNVKNILEKYELDQKKLDERNKTINARFRWKTFIEQTADELAIAEAGLNSTICKEIETKACAYFKAIMQNEDVNLSLIKPDTSEELALELCDFYNKNNVHALPVLSESYRNALAISIFMAALMRHKGNAKFIVFDDITSSFDAGNQYALMDVFKNLISIAKNADGLQVIILSHDGLLEKYFDKQSTEDDSWYHVKLRGLAPTGSIIADPQQYNRLKVTAEEHIKNGNIESAYPFLRQYLEYKLTEVINKLDIPVPIDYAIRDDKKMVSNSLTAIMDAVNMHKECNKLILTQAQYDNLSNILVPGIICNWVNHYETASRTSISPRVLLGVINSVDAFCECFQYYCSCNGAPKLVYYKSLSRKRCNKC